MGQKMLWDALKKLAKDGWITIKPNGRRNKGQPVLLGENGEILGGMGGKFNGLKMKDVKEVNKKLKQKNERAKSGHSKGESPELHNASAIPGDYKNSPDFKKLTPDAQTMVNQTAVRIQKLPLAEPALYEELDKVIKELANNGSKFDSKVSEMMTNLNIAAMSAAAVASVPPKAEIPHTQKADISQYQQFAGYNNLDKYTKSWFDEKADALMKADMNPADKEMLTYGMQLALQNGVDPKKKAEKYGGKFLGKALGVMDAIGGIAQANKQGNQKMLDFYKNAAKQSIEALGGATPGASNTPAATTTSSSVSPAPSQAPSQAPSASGEILPNQKGNLKDYKNFTGYDKLSMTSKMVLDDAVQSLQKAMSDMNLDDADMAKVTKGVQTALSKSVDGKLGADVQHMLTAAKNAAKSLYGSEAYNNNMVKALKYAKQIEQQSIPVEVQQKEAAKQADYQKQQEFKNTHSYTQQTTDTDRNKFKYKTDKFLSDQAKADVAAIPSTLQNGKFAKTKHKSKFEQELGEGGDSFKKYSGMAYGLMNSSDKDLATKAQNIAVAVANGQMDGSKAISLLRSMDAMQKVKDYTGPKNEPPAFTSIHNNAVHNSGAFNASALPQSIRKAIKQYTGPAYAQINGQLRAGEKLRKANQDVVNKLNEAFAQPEVKAKENFTVYRGITSTQLLHLTMGSTMTDKGFVSTSSNANEAKKFAGSDGALMEIRVKKGQPAMSVKDTSAFPSEDEVMLPANTSFKVVGKKIGPEGRPVLIVDYVPPANLAKDRALTYLQRAGWASTHKDDARRRQAIFDALRRL